MTDPSRPAPRVLQVVLSLNPGGTEQLVLDIVARLGPTVPMMVACLDEAGQWASRLDAHGVEVHALGRRPGFHPSLGRALSGLVRRHRATVLHAHHYSPFVYGCLARLWTRDAPVVYTEHGRVSDAPPSAKRRLANQVFSRVPARVFAVSEDLKHHMVAEGFHPSRVGVVYNGIDAGPRASAATRAEVRATLGVDDAVFVVGTIARLDPVKNLGTLVAAADRFRQRDPRLLVIVVGDGPERGGLEAAARATGLDAHVRFLGHRDDARRWLAGCDAFVNSSVSEGVSLTILEAMAAGLPVVATAVGGTPEVVTDECGRLVPARDAPALAEALLVMAADPSGRRALGAAGRRRVEERFSIDRMVEAYRDVYASLG